MCWFRSSSAASCVVCFCDIKFILSVHPLPIPFRLAFESAGFNHDSLDHDGQQFTCLQSIPSLVANTESNRRLKNRNPMLKQTIDQGADSFRAIEQELLLIGNPVLRLTYSPLRYLPTDSAVFRNNAFFTKLSSFNHQLQQDYASNLYLRYFFVSNG